MRKVIALLMALSLVCFSVPVFAEEQAESPRILVAYLSRAGENYNVGVTPGKARPVPLMRAILKRATRPSWRR